MSICSTGNITADVGSRKLGGAGAFRDAEISTSARLRRRGRQLEVEPRVRRHANAYGVDLRLESDRLDPERVIARDDATDEVEPIVPGTSRTYRAGVEIARGDEDACNWCLAGTRDDTLRPVASSDY